MDGKTSAPPYDAIQTYPHPPVGWVQSRPTSHRPLLIALSSPCNVNFIFFLKIVFFISLQIVGPWIAAEALQIPLFWKFSILQSNERNLLWLAPQLDQISAQTSHQGHVTMTSSSELIVQLQQNSICIQTLDHCPNSKPAKDLEWSLVWGIMKGEENNFCEKFEC